MKIAQIAPLANACPPKLHGGTERVVAYLADELVRQGHDVTLFASGDSETFARLVPCAAKALRLDPAVRDFLPHQVRMLGEVRRRFEDFDVLHFHGDSLHYPMIEDFADRTVTTLYGRLDLPDLEPLFSTFPEVPLVSVSEDQRSPVPPVNWIGTVYHGLPLELMPYRAKSAGYLAFLGRITPEKRPDRAIEIALRSGMELRLAGRIDPADQAYWETEIAPLVAAHDGIRYLGEIDEAQKAEFLGQARALLFPIDGPEPFGLVMIEAMACGTPVVAFNCGAVPEVIDHAMSGFIVNSMEEAVDAVGRLGDISRAQVRASFEERFTAQRMAADYVRIYRSLAGARRDAARLRRQRGEGMGLQVVA